MIRLRYAVLGDAANRTSLDRANVLGIFGSISGDALPIVVTRCAMAVAFLGEPDDAGKAFRFEGGIWQPGGEVMSAIRGEFEMTVGAGGWPEWLLTCDFEELTFLEAGLYSLRFRWGKGDLPAEFNFEMPLPVVLKVPEEDTVSRWKGKLKNEWKSGKKWIRGK